MTQSTGTIHDLGYKRYVGTRRAPSTRWRVIMRDQVASAWKTWWRYKSALALAVTTTIAAAAIMVFLQDETIRRISGGVVRQLRLLDIVTPLTVEWYLRWAFLVSLTVGAATIAGDRQSGAFTFYFARSVRPRDYVLGKLAGLMLLVGLLVVVGPLLLAAVRIGLAESLSEAIDLLAMVPAVLVAGTLAMLAYASVPLGFSALVGNRRHALALWAAYYLAFGFIVSFLGKVTSPWISALDIHTAIRAVTYELFDLPAVLRGRMGRISMEAALGSVLVHSGVAIAIIWSSVTEAQRSGVGGSS